MYMFELLLFIVIYTILQSVKQNNLVIIDVGWVHTHNHNTGSFE